MSTNDTAQPFAPWVVSHAADYRENRTEAARIARALTVEQLARPAGDAGWTLRDEIVHLAAADPDFIGVLSAIVAGEVPGTSVFADVDARNVRNLAAWSGRSMDDVANALETNRGTLEGLLAKLTAEDESRQPEGMPFPLGVIVKGYGMHAPYHLGQVRAATEGTD